MHTIGIRPEHIEVSTEKGMWKGTVGVAEHLGSDTFFHVHADNLEKTLTVRAPGSVEIESGSTIYLTPDSAMVHRFDDQGIRIV